MGDVSHGHVRPCRHGCQRPAAGGFEAGVRALRTVDEGCRLRREIRKGDGPCVWSASVIDFELCGVSQSKL